MRRVAAVLVLLALVAVALPAPVAAADCAAPEPGMDCRADPYVLDHPVGEIWYADFGATVEAGETTPCGMQATTWFRFTASETRDARFDARRPNTDHGVAIAAWDGTTLLGCASSSSDLRFACVAGRTYDVQVGSESAARGTIQMLFDTCGPFTTPSAPWPLHATPGPGRGEVTLTWTAPDFDGGHPVTGYVVTVRDGCSGSPSTATFDGSTRSHVVTGLTEAEEACFTAAAVNALGTGDATPSWREPAGVASAPWDVRAFAQGDRVLVQWERPLLDGGSTPSYRLEASTHADGPFAGVANAGATAGSAFHRGVAPATTYHYRVVPVNAWGDGLPSALVSVTTPDLPGPPRAVSAEPDDVPLAVLVDWDEPLSNGGAAIVRYEVWRAAASGGDLALHATVAGATSYRDTRVAPNAAYVYEIRAVNGVGTGPASERACGRPLVFGDLLFGDACR